MEQVLARRAQIAEAAQRLRAVRAATGRSSATAPTGSPPRRSGSSCRELCYKSIACDATEDKKHIDLSSEPLILVCAAGLTGPNADDVAKEVAIYRAHKAAPIVIATEGEARFAAALAVIAVPAVHPDAGLRAVGHGRPPVRLRGGAGHRRPGPAAARGPGRGRGVVADGRDARATCSTGCAPPIEPPAPAFLDGLRAGAYDGAPRGEHGRAAGVAAALRHRRSSRSRPTSSSYGKVGTPARRGRGPHRRAHPRHRRADPSGRRHQAPGQDRHRRHLPLRGRAAPTSPLVRGGAGRRAPPATGSSYRALRTLAGLDPAVEEVTGYTRYRIEGSCRGTATIHVLDKRRRRGRTSRPAPTSDPALKGTKHRAASSGRSRSAAAAATAARSVLVPETKDNAGHRHHAAARRVRRPAARGRGPRVSGYRDRLRGARRRGHRDRAQRSATRCSARCRSSTCWSSRSTSCADHWRT